MIDDYWMNIFSYPINVPFTLHFAAVLMGSIILLNPIIWVVTLIFWLV